MNIEIRILRILLLGRMLAGGGADRSCHAQELILIRGAGAGQYLALGSGRRTLSVKLRASAW